MNKEFRNFRDYVLRKLDNADDAKEYLQVALEEYLLSHNKEAFYQALKDVVDARGGASKIARESNISRQNLYKIFSAKTNPRLETIAVLLNILGFQLTIS